MSAPSTCPDISLLSQVLDHEASQQEEQDVTQHLVTCTDCRMLMSGLQRATARGRAALAQSFVPSSLAAPTPSCLAPETIVAYVQRILSAPDNEVAERHLHTCDACFYEVQSALRATSLLSAQEKKRVPAALKTQVAALWQSAKVAKQQPALSRVVIQLAEKGLQLLEQHLVAPFFNLQEMMAPAPTYRSEATPTRLDFSLTAERCVISLAVVPDNNGVAVTLTLFDVHQQRLAGQRMFLNQQGKAIVSKKTDQQGILRVPHLDPGLYEITCPGRAAAFEVEFHS
jgi:anti-sigma factor RsiW